MQLDLLRYPRLLECRPVLAEGAQSESGVLHEFQREAQRATSQNPDLRLTCDGSLHVYIGCPFSSRAAALLFFRGGKELLLCMIIRKLWF